MQVTVKLFASLARFSPDEQSAVPFIVDLGQSSTLQQLIDQLGMPASELKIAFVNGLICDLDWVLQPGDQVGIFPPVGGG